MSKFFKLSEISLVTGPSGAGKTTYANNLSKQTGVPAYHIDDDKIWQKWYNSNRTKPLKETKESYRKVSEKLNRKYLNIRTPAIIEGQQLLEAGSFPKHINKVYIIDPGMDEVIRRRISRNPTRNTADFAKELYTAGKPKMDFLLSVNDPRFEKISEYAPGIPDRNTMTSLPNVTSGQKWEFVVQEHRANRAGLHMDFRIGPPGGVGFSWVLKNGLPRNGEKTLAIRQPDHTLKYFEFEGKIKSGYGAGEVKIIDSGQVEVLKANDDKITFYLPRGSQVEKYTMIKTNGNDWLMLNHTLPESTKNLINVGKLKYKDMSKNYTKELGDFSVPKIDGAYSTTLLRSGKTPLVFGYRESKRTGNLIEYTPKIQRVLESRGPKELGTTLLRTEVFAVTPQGEELPNRLLGGILNSNVFRSRELQKQQSSPLQLAAFDILKYKGKDVTNKSPEEKLELIRKVSESYPLIQHPIDLSRRYNFREGSVVWRNNVPIKVKNRPDYDVFVKNVFRANTRAGSPRAGGFTYSLTPDGPEIGRVGSGFLHSELQDMLNNPDKYKGRVAKVYAMSQHPSGSLRAPSFNTWHLDKGEINE